MHLYTVIGSSSFYCPVRCQLWCDFDMSLSICLRRWLQLRFDFDSIRFRFDAVLLRFDAIRLQFGCDSTSKDGQIAFERPSNRSQIVVVTTALPLQYRRYFCDSGISPISTLQSRLSAARAPLAIRNIIIALMDGHGDEPQREAISSKAIDLMRRRISLYEQAMSNSTVTSCDDVTAHSRFHGN